MQMQIAGKVLVTIKSILVVDMYSLDSEQGKHANAGVRGVRHIPRGRAAALLKQARPVSGSTRLNSEIEASPLCQCSTGTLTWKHSACSGPAAGPKYLHTKAGWNPIQDSVIALCWQLRRKLCV